MIARKIFLLLGLCLAFVASASEPSQPATQTDIQQVQQQIQVLDKELTVLKEVTANRLDSQDKRVGDLGLWTSQQANHMSSIANASTLLGIFIAIISILAGLAVFFTTKHHAIEEAKKHAEIEARNWFSQNNSGLMTQIEKLKNLASEHERYADLFRDLLDKASQKILISKDLENSDPATLEALAAVTNASRALNAKPEDQFTADDHYVRGLEDFASKRFESALISFQKALDKAATENISPDRHANIISACAIALCELERFQEAIPLYDMIDQLYGTESTPTVRAQVAKALYNKSVALDRLHRSEDKIRVTDLIDQRYSNDPDPAVRKHAATTLFNKGVDLGKLSRNIEEIQTYDLIVDRYGQDESFELRKLVAEALLYKGLTLSELDRQEEAMKTYKQVIQRYAGDSNPEVEKLVERAQRLLNKLRGDNEPEAEPA
ncbi:tetratricopeptide repeat protein [Comamonas sp. 26]|uniref:tetratricopeptide repeat protein n=1 Tax=Comamonas sp. 26 TaxID=2035201 RepID=UPI000C17B1B9|nr:hypothetical protein [Comamonas sp. 26]PIG08775.1 hypothetical protein CLU84_1646 [Comamonas sp. 26]